MFKTVLIIVFLANNCFGEFFCPFPENVPNCECRIDIGMLICQGKTGAIPLPKLDEDKPIKFNEVILENIQSPSTGNNFFSKIEADKITIKKMDNSLLKNIEKTKATQLVLEDIEKIDFNEFLKLDFNSLKHLTIKGSSDDTKIKETVNVFDNLPYLTFIDLNGHKIKDFQVDSFKKLDHLEKIDLSNNLINLATTPNKFEFSSTDLTIDLSNNNIDDSRISDKLLFKTKPNGFISVNLTGNSITLLKENIFNKYCKTGGISINLKDNKQMSCIYNNIKWLFNCEKSFDIFQNLYCKEYDKLFDEMSLDDFIDRDRPFGKLEITIISVNLTDPKLVNVAVCVQDPSDKIDDEIQCQLCIKPGKDDTKENEHIFGTECKIDDKDYREDSVITIGIAEERHSNLDLKNVEGFASISIYEDIVKSQMNNKDYTIKNPTWTAVVKINWTEKTKTI